MNPMRSFRHFFFRGLGILLPTVLTIWILVAVYQFVATRIASPINRGVQELVVRATPWPQVYEAELVEVREHLPEARRQAWLQAGGTQNPDWIRIEAKRVKLQKWWDQFYVMDLIGLIIAIVLIYMVGAFVGSYLGNRLYARGEELMGRVPVFKQVYPHVKQVVEFFFGDRTKRLQFNRVVAVQYPRKGLWSLGLVTGDTMRSIQDKAGADCMTVFVPSSPTPFTGYVITVPKTDTVELDISIDDALRFTVSGGVIVPQAQLIQRHDRDEEQMGSPEPVSARDAGSSGRDHE
jgi:uncharacterized membrane protein